jgi:hypothetical protein
VPALGSLVNEIELYPHCATADPVEPQFEDMLARFQARCSTLPIVRVYRRHKRAFVSYASKWVHTDAAFGAATVHPDSQAFETITCEMAGALCLLTPRFKSSDDFAVKRLALHVTDRASKLPPDQDALRSALERYLEARERAGSRFSHC